MMRDTASPVAVAVLAVTVAAVTVPSATEATRIVARVRPKGDDDHFGHWRISSCLVGRKSEQTPSPWGNE